MTSSYFTGEKFQVLSSYFADLTVEDLQLFDDDDFIDSVEPKHRGLMKVWLKTRDTMQAERPLEIRHKEGKISLQHQVAGRDFAHLCPERTPIWHLKDLIVDPAEVYVVDIGECALRDNDLEDVCLLVLSLPSLKVLHLNGNRLHKDVDAIREIAQRVLVDIRFNPMASIDNKSFFESYDYDSESLIWLSYDTLKSPNKAWIGLVGTPERASAIEEIHLDFYTKYPNCK